jgi:hypothetical protein
MGGRWNGMYFPISRFCGKMWHLQKVHFWQQKQIFLEWCLWKCQNMTGDTCEAKPPISTGFHLSILVATSHSQVKRNAFKHSHTAELPRLFLTASVSICFPVCLSSPILMHYFWCFDVWQSTKLLLASCQISAWKNIYIQSVRNFIQILNCEIWGFHSCDYSDCQSHVMSDDRSVSKSIWGSWPDFNYCWTARDTSIMRLSLTRGWVYEV